MRESGDVGNNRSREGSKSVLGVRRLVVGGERAGAVALVRLRVPAWYSLYLLYLYRRTNTDAKCCGKRAPAAALRTRALSLLAAPALRAAAYAKQNGCL